MITQFSDAHTQGVNSLAFSPCVTTPYLLCSTGCDDTAALWDTRLGGGRSSAVARLRHHTDSVNYALFLTHEQSACSDSHGGMTEATAESTTLLVASDDATMSCWDLRQTSRPVSVVAGFDGGVNHMTVLPDYLTDKFLASSTTLPDEVATRPASALALVASACDDGHVYIHALDRQRCVGNSTSSVSACAVRVDKFWASMLTVNELLVLPHSDVLLTGLEDGALRTWRLFEPGYQTGRVEDEPMISSLIDFCAPINHIALVPPELMERVEEGAAQCTRRSGSHAGAAPHASSSASAGANDDEEEDGASVTGQAVSHLFAQRQGGEWAVTALPASASGAAAVCREESGSLAADMLGRRRRRSSANPFPSPPLQHDRHQRAEEEEDGSGCCWVVAACGECIYGVDVGASSGEFGSGAKSYLGHKDFVRGLQFTPSGTLLTVSDDSTAMEWNVMTGEAVRAVQIHDGYVMASALSRSGDVLATGSHKGEIRLWRLPFTTERMDVGASVV